MEENNQPVFNEFEPELIKIHPVIKPYHKKILDSIDENTSNAVRIVIDQYHKHKQTVNKDKIIIDLCLGMLLIGVAISVSIWYAALVFYGTGVGCIVYGMLYFFENRRHRYV